MTGIIIWSVIGIVLIIMILYGIALYNALINLKHSVDKAWSNVDVLLKQRFDELPKLVEVVKGYRLHEKEVLENITKARAMLENATSEKTKHEAENMLTRSLRSLFAVAENYPELKADRAFLELQARISQLEEMIADRRELYNEYVNTYNIRLEQFPDVILARWMGLKPKPLWKTPESQRQDVKISFE